MGFGVFLLEWARLDTVQMKYISRQKICRFIGSKTYNSWQKGILFRWPIGLEQSPDVPEWSHTQSGLF